MDLVKGMRREERGGGLWSDVVSLGVHVQGAVVVAQHMSTMVHCSTALPKQNEVGDPVFFESA